MIYVCASAWKTYMSITNVVHAMHIISYHLCYVMLCIAGPIPPILTAVMGIHNGRLAPFNESSKFIFQKTCRPLVMLGLDWTPR